MRPHRIGQLGCAVALPYFTSPVRLLCRREQAGSHGDFFGGGDDYSAATRLPSAALTAGITFSAISSMERLDSAGSAQSLPQ